MTVKSSYKEIIGPFPYKYGTRTLHGVYSLEGYNGEGELRYFFDKESLDEACKLEDPFSHPMAFKQSYVEQAIRYVTSYSGNHWDEIIAKLEDSASSVRATVFLNISKVVTGQEMRGDVEVPLIGMLSRIEVAFSRDNLTYTKFFTGYVSALRAAVSFVFKANLDSGNPENFKDLAGFQEELERLIPKIC
jgi:hypothetical protein